MATLDRNGMRPHIEKAAFGLVSSYVIGLRERARRMAGAGSDLYPLPILTALITRVVSRPERARGNCIGVPSRDPWP